MPASRAAVCAALLTLVGLTVAGCGDDLQSTPSSGGGARNAPGSPTAGQATPQPSGTADGTDASTGQGEPFKIHITVGDQRFPATIFGSAAGRDLVARLPLTMEMTDHGSVEKTGPLPASLSLDGQPDGADPDVGDIGYYAPGNDLVLYYGDQSYHPGIVVIGRLDGDGAGRVAGMEGAITATVEMGAG